MVPNQMNKVTIRTSVHGFCHGNNTCVWAGLFLTKDDFFPCQIWPLFAYLFLYLVSNVCIVLPHNCLVSGKIIYQQNVFCIPEKSWPWPFRPTVLPLVSLAVVTQHVSIGLTTVLSLGYNSGSKFYLWSQTGAKNLVGCVENGSNFARTFPRWCVYRPVSRADNFFIPNSLVKMSYSYSDDIPTASAISHTFSRQSSIAILCIFVMNSGVVALFGHLLRGSHLSFPYQI
jgi:hypothetical protein